MSTKSKRRSQRRHPAGEQGHSSRASAVGSPVCLRGEQRTAAGEIIGAVLNLVTLGAVAPEAEAAES